MSHEEKKEPDTDKYVLVGLRRMMKYLLVSESCRTAKHHQIKLYCIFFILFFIKVFYPLEKIGLLKLRIFSHYKVFMKLHIPDVFILLQVRET